MPLPALSRRDHLHHAIVGEDAEHDLHLRPELVLRERLEQNLFGLNMRQPSSPNGIVTLCCRSSSDRLAFEARIAEQLRNRICAHSFPFLRATSRRFMGPPLKPRAGNYHTSPLGENAVVPHSKIDCRMAASVG